MKQLIKSPDKYDSNYINDERALFIGILAIVVWLVQVTGHITTASNWYLLTIPFRIICVIWIRKMCDDQNRELFWNGFLGFFFPAVMLIGVSRMKKLNLTFTVDTSYSPDVQYTEFKEYASKFIRKGKYKEAAFVYKYIIENLPHNQRDVDAFMGLQKKQTESKVSKPTVAVVVFMIMASMCNAGEVYKYKSYYNILACGGKIQKREASILIVIDCIKNKVNIYAKQTSTFDIISQSPEVTEENGDQVVNWIGIDSLGDKCKIIIRAVDKPVGKHIGSLTVRYPAGKCSASYFLKSND